MDGGVYCPPSTGGPYVGSMEVGNILYADYFTAGGTPTFVASRWVYRGYYYQKIYCTANSAGFTAIQTEMTLNLYDFTTSSWVLSSSAQQTDYGGALYCASLGTGTFWTGVTLTARWATMGYTFSTTTGNVYEVWAGFYVDPNISLPAGAASGGAGICTTMDNSSLCNGASGTDRGAYLDNGTIY